jgi:hypothetical protein
MERLKSADPTSGLAVRLVNDHGWTDRVRRRKSR